MDLALMGIQIGVLNIFSVVNGSFSTRALKLCGVVSESVAVGRQMCWCLRTRPLALCSAFVNWFQAIHLSLVLLHC